MKIAQMKKKYLSVIAALIVSFSMTPMVHAASVVSEQESNNSMDCANIISLNTSYKGNLSSRDDVDYYQFTLKDAGNLTVNFAHKMIAGNTTTYWNVSLLDSDNNEIMSYSVSGKQSNTFDNMGLPKGTYYIKISKGPNYNDYNSMDYNLTANFQKSAVYESEFNNDLSSANPISLDTKYTGKLNSHYDVDNFKFTLPSDGKLAVNFNHSNIPGNSTELWYIRILDQDNTEYTSFSSKGNQPSVTSYISLPKGTYYLEIHKGSNYNDYNSMDYTFNINLTKSNYFEKEFNDSLDTANPIALNTKYTAKLDSRYDNDYYEFTLPSDGKINLNFAHNSIPGDKTYLWNIEVLDNDKTFFLGLKSSGNKSQCSDYVTLPKGTYFLKVVKGDNYNDYSPLDYTIAVNFESSDAYEKEYNDSMDKASDIQLNKQYTGRIGSVDDTDFYKFTVLNDGNISLSFSHSLLAGNNSNPWTASILDSDNTEYAKIYSKGNSTKDETTLKLKKGTYYLKITKGPNYYDSSSIDYKFTITGSVPGFRALASLTNVPVNKVLSIDYSDELDINTLIQNNIYVTDSNYKIVPVFIYSNTRDKKIYIAPINAYDKNTTYTLLVKELKSKSGKVTKVYTKTSFTTIKQ